MGGPVHQPLITVQSATSNGLTLSVNYGTTTCTHAILTVSVSPHNPSLSAGSRANYTLSIINLDSSGCAPGTFTLAASQPAGWMASLSSSSLTLSPGQTGSVTMTDVVPASAGPGTYPVGASAANNGLVGSGTASCTVLAPPGTLTDILTVSGSSFKLRKAVSMTATVMNGGLPASGAGVTFTIIKADGSTATGQATTDSSGSASWSYRLVSKDPIGSYSAKAVEASGSQSAISNSISLLVQ